MPIDDHGRGERLPLRNVERDDLARFLEDRAHAAPRRGRLGEAGDEHDSGGCVLIGELWRGEQPRCDDLVRTDPRRRVGAERRCRGGGVAGVAEHAAHAGPRARRAAAGRRRARRTFGRIPGARDRARDRTAHDRLLHLGNRGREPASRGRRGPSRARPAARLHGRSTARAARLGRGPDDRPDASVRRRGALVPRPGPARRPRGRRRGERALAFARGPLGCGRDRYSRRPGAPQSSVPRAARPDRRAAASTRPAAPTGRRGPAPRPRAASPS